MKSFFKKYYYFIIAGVFTLAILAIAFLSGGNVQEAKRSIEEAPLGTSYQGETYYYGAAEAIEESTEAEESTVEDSTSSTKPTDTAPTTVPATTEKPKATQPATKATQPVKQKATSATSPVESGNKKAVTPSATKPVPAETKSQDKKDTALHCKLSISCSTVLSNMDKLDPDLTEVIPSDGWILSSTSVEFKSGESVFDVLKRVCSRKKIHMEFNTASYDSAYIEGINNLYEFDCGANSGWMYKVNGTFPNYGCSKYDLKDGDVIEWVYTCNLGYDVGGGKVS